MSIKVVLADDHAVVIDGIKAVVSRKAKNDIEVIGEASNGYEAIEMAKKNLADVYVLDITMPQLNGIDTAKEILKIHPNVKIIILSMHDDKILVEKALKNGVKGYVLKDNATEEVINAIKEVYKDGCYLSPKISKYLVQEFLIRDYLPAENDVSLITPREREILQLIAEGLSSKEIAKKIDISFNTVLRHRSNIMQKLAIHTQAGLVRYALKEGISEL